MLLPGDNYSEQLMFTVESYKEQWVDKRLTVFYGETIAALNSASELSKEDRKQIKELKAKYAEGTGYDEQIEYALDLFDAGRKTFRFAKYAAPLILADGPLPFGDAIFLIALGLDAAIAIYGVAAND
jgi:hypothetical protein